MLRLATIHSRRAMRIIAQKRSASLRALTGMVLIGLAAHAGLPYLPLAGPPAMRQEAKIIPPVAAVSEAPPVKAPTNVPPVLQTLEVATNAPEEAKVPVEVLAVPGGMTDHTFVSPTFTATGQGVASITPQILATYFRPVTIGTNMGVIGGMLPIGFVPPFTPVESRADSRAEYIVK